MKLPRSQTPSQRRASILFADCTRNYGGGAGCRIEYAGPLPKNGGPSRVSLSGIRWEDRQRLAYRHLNKVRLKKSDRVIAVCDNPRCLDKRHLYCIPAPVPPKQPKPSRVPPADPADTARTPNEAAAVLSAAPDAIDTP